MSKIFGSTILDNDSGGGDSGAAGVPLMGGQVITEDMTAASNMEDTVNIELVTV